MSAQNMTDKKSTRPTLGFIIDSLVSGYQVDLWRGAKAAAAKFDVNLISFVGREINSILADNAQANEIYRLINSSTVDGIVAITGTLSHFVTAGELNEFFQGFAPLPVVSIAAEIEGMPSILLDNYRGIREITAHLIETHGYQNIGFARMREGHGEGDTRLEAYKKTLEEFGLPFQPQLVLPGELYDDHDGAADFLIEIGIENIDALVVVDDYFALPIQERLQLRGIRIPEDIAIVGFDDVEETRYVDPPLTTIRQPLSEQAHRAVSILMDMLQGQSDARTVMLSPELILRQSCGCTPNFITQAVAPPSAPQADTLEISLHKDELVNLLVQEINPQQSDVFQKFAESYLDAVQESDAAGFIAALGGFLRAAVRSGSEEIIAWQSAISLLRSYSLPRVADPEKREFIENLIQQGRVIVADRAERTQAHRRLLNIQQQSTFRNLSQELNTAENFGELLEVVSDQSQNLGITWGTISFYDRRDPAASSYNLALAYTPEGRAELPPAGLSYPAGQLLPEAFMPEDEPFALIIEALYFQEDQFGFAIFKSGNLDEAIYDPLAQQISSGLEGALRVQQVAQRALQLQTASEVSRAASSILDPDELIMQTVELVKERFGLYYAGLFLVDETKQMAVLRAGSGEPGKNMLAENWQLEVGGSSMIGRCVTTGTADIQLDVDHAPVHLRNPHLPETKSEMALPLISRGVPLGALTIQSTQSGAFSQEDIDVLQTMANQLANAISNANLFEQTQTSLTETESLLNIAQLAADAVDFQAAIPEILNLTLAATGIHSGLISVVNPQTNQLEIVAHQIPQSFYDKLIQNGLEGTLCDLVHQQGEAIAITDMSKEAPIDVTGVLNLGFKSYQGAPLEAKGVSFGTICTFDPTPLSEEDHRITLLQAIGQQLGVALENARLFEQTQIALDEIQALQRRYEIQAWSAYNRGRENTGFQQTQAGLKPLRDELLPETENTVSRGTPSIIENESDALLTVPIMLRDQPIGAVGVQGQEGKRHWTPEEVALVEDITEQFALAAESLRLLDETQRRAARERLVTDITTKLRATTDPQTMLQTAAAELRQALNATRAQILIHPDNRAGGGE